MPFPPVDRVIYGKTPLKEVVCQLRFPRILRIDADVPAAFQERVRSEYPIVQSSQFGPDVQLPPELRPTVEFHFAGGPTKSQTFDFLSDDHAWQIGLTSEFIALTTTSYVRWEQFRDRIHSAVNAFVEIYNPADFTRVGLRYVDLITRSELKLNNVAWPELLNPNLCGELASPELKDEIHEARRQLLVTLPGKGRAVRVRHGLQRKDKTGEQCYLIDADFFTPEKTGTSDAISSLNEFRSHAGRLFRWCIQRRLHDAMEPAPVSES